MMSIGQGPGAVTVRELATLPNLISGARLLAAPVLVALALLGLESAFRLLLIGALLSDVVDGWVARTFGLQTRIGAMLDSAADVTTLVAATVGVAVFHGEVLEAHWVGCAAVLGGWSVVAAIALVRYGRLSSFHTYASKAAGYALGVFLIVLFAWGFSAWLFELAVAVSVASSIEELVLLRLLRRWRADVRGLWWVLREPKPREARAATPPRGASGN